MVLNFICDVCHRTYTKSTTNPKQKPTVNEAIVWGTLGNGSTDGHTEEILSIVDIKFMGRSKFQKLEANFRKKITVQNITSLDHTEYERLWFMASYIDSN